MLYLVTLVIFLIWAIYVIRKGCMTWHTILSIYFVTVFVVDFGDVPCGYWFHFYDLEVHLLSNLDVGHYLGIIFSDGLIFPLIAIVFCYYTARHHHPWILSFIFAFMLGIIEFVYVKLGFMVYHYWFYWTTAVLAFLTLRVLACFSARFIDYTPPVSYRFRLLCAIYVISEWPGAILGGAMRLYQYKPYIFTNETANDRFIAMILATIMGATAAVLIKKIPKKYRIILFLGLGVSSSIFASWMHWSGLLQYKHWNSYFTIIRYMMPYLIVYLYDRWESCYIKKL